MSTQGSCVPFSEPPCPSRGRACTRGCTAVISRAWQLGALENYQLGDDEAARLLPGYAGDLPQLCPVWTPRGVRLGLCLVWPKAECGRGTAAPPLSLPSPCASPSSRKHNKLIASKLLV